MIFYLGLKVGLPPFVKSIAAKVIDAKATRRKMMISFILILEKNCTTKIIVPFIQSCEKTK
jgi:hypothetical protein